MQTMIFVTFPALSLKLSNTDTSSPAQLYKEGHYRQLTKNLPPPSPLHSVLNVLTNTPPSPRNGQR